MSDESMEIRELAERVLFGQSLEEKLVPVGRLTDRHPGAACATPAAPGRPAALRLDRWNDDERLPFTQVRDLAREEERGLVLHFFANHELLAAELMALVLLKFPDAPAKFRRGVAQTLKDEQEHVRLYLARMERAGVEFGRIPVSDFFWRAIAPMPSPMDFVTRLSLTLEQANLDYAPHYRRLFGDLGDDDTAALLERIYRDEIGHVKHGLNWFNRWRPPERTVWESFGHVLGPPMSPSRAKGIGGFNREGRRAAGLPDDFIDELEVYARSHGRCPDLWWFHPTCDLAAGRQVAITPSAPVRDLAQDLATVPGLLAAPEDIVAVPQVPSLGFRRAWKEAGLPLVEWVAWEPSTQPPPATLDRRLTRLQPWGWSPESAQALQPLAGHLPEGAPTPAQEWHAERRRLYAKSWSAAWLARVLPELQSEEGEGWLCAPETVGRPCASIDEAEAALGALAEQGVERAVMKADFGTAGGQHSLVDLAVRHGGQAPREAVVDAGDESARCGRSSGTDATDGLLLPEHQRRWLERSLADAGAVVVEPWLDRVLDLSAHYEVEDGGVRFLGTTRFLADERGRFQGVVVEHDGAGLDGGTLRFLYGDGRDHRRIPRLFGRLGEWLRRDLPADVRGPVSLDALVYRDAAGVLRLKPVVEVNPRYTMGRVGLALRRRVLSGRTAVWRLWRRRDVLEAGFDDAPAWAAQLRDRLPLEMDAGGRQISRGAVFTGDPASVRGVLSLLLVAPSLDELRAATDPLPVMPAGGPSR
jgi:uncharacterized ferritin-like protein (DUF455 family)